MNGPKSLSKVVVALVCLSASTALALPRIRACSAYKSWATGIIQLSELSPQNDQAAYGLALNRCYNLWRDKGGNDLTWANAGNTAKAWRSSSSATYEYQCLICLDAGGPPMARWPGIELMEAVEKVRTRLGGRIVSVTPRIPEESEGLEAYYEVSVVVGDHQTQVFVDGSTGEVLVPEVTTSIEEVPENVCR
ncbi:PepSY domain-containing protein [Pyxidicoccus sp. MSG2]|uniref:PepSY domain-containing protein n=1 Tax=Pyxidicoccus sp. MSG2 TaxID=2996790 RepID=UPI00226FE285|nr:PepSY domain-containing protein [Pyxidicoccus sp. MSG2]MCY1022840.1 PepSY domain-containing protein [Pyxidicoccus sp. MSG2]